MSTLTKLKDKIATELDKHPKIKPWIWFVVLWCSGLMAVSAFAYVIKVMMK